MRDINQVILLGRITERMKKVKVGDKYRYSFTVAVNTYSSKLKKQFSQYIPVYSFKDDQDIMMDTIKKGSSVFVLGSIDVRTYMKDNTKRWMTEIKGREVLQVRKFNESEDMDVALKGMISEYLKEVQASQEGIDQECIEIENDELDIKKES